MERINQDPQVLLQHQTFILDLEEDDRLLVHASIYIRTLEMFVEHFSQDLRNDYHKRFAALFKQTRAFQAATLHRPGKRTKEQRAVMKETIDLLATYYFDLLHNLGMLKAEFVLPIIEDLKITPHIELMLHTFHLMARSKNPMGILSVIDLLEKSETFSDYDHLKERGQTLKTLAGTMPIYRETLNQAASLYTILQGYNAVNPDKQEVMVCPICRRQVNLKVRDTDPRLTELLEGAKAQACSNEYYTHYDNRILVINTLPETVV